MNDFIIKDLNDETVILYKACFDNNDNFKHPEKIKWQFLQNTEKKAFVDIAVDRENEKTAAILALSCVLFKIENKYFLGSQSLDTITDVNYRGKGLFVKLAKDVFAKATDAGASLVYGFPNGKSIDGYKNKLEWKVLDPLPFLIKPLQTKYFFDKIKPLKILPNINLRFSKFKKPKDFIFKEDNNFPLEINDLWTRFSENIKVTVNRNKDYLDWRYILKPNEKYKIIHCYDLDNVYKGFIIYAVKEKHNGKIAYIMELMYDLEAPKIGDYLLNYAIDGIKKEGADCVLSWCFEHSPIYPNYKKQLFFSMPEKLRPIELHFGVRSFDKNLQEIIYDRRNWFLSYSDSDTV